MPDKVSPDFTVCVDSTFSAFADLFDVSSVCDGRIISLVKLLTFFSCSTVVPLFCAIFQRVSPCLTLISAAEASVLNAIVPINAVPIRSEERRVGKEVGDR